MAIATTITALVKEEIDPATMACQEELILDGHKIKSINEEDSQTLSHFKTLKSLSMNQTYLNSVAGLPLLPNLEVLELADNKLSADSSLEVIAQRCPKLHTLILAGNKLTDLAFLKGFSTLEVLDVDVNPITASKQSEAEVRAALFKEFPNLKIVNSRDRDGNDVEDAESESDTDEESGDSEQGPRIVGDDVENKKGSGASKNSLLKSFYEKDYNQDEDDDDDEEDFNPDSFEDSEENSDDEEEADDDETPDDKASEEGGKEGEEVDLSTLKAEGKRAEEINAKAGPNVKSETKPNGDGGKRKVGIGLTDTSPLGDEAAKAEEPRKRKSEPQQDNSRRKKRV